MEQKRASHSEQRNPQHQVEKMSGKFQELVKQLRGDIDKIDEPRAKAMFETSAEVLIGLQKALHDYERKNEVAWRD
jgi:hypothetical protein